MSIEKEDRRELERLNGSVGYVLYGIKNIAERNKDADIYELVEPLRKVYETIRVLSRDPEEKESNS